MERYVAIATRVPYPTGTKTELFPRPIDATCILCEILKESRGFREVILKCGRRTLKLLNYKLTYEPSAQVS